MALRLQQAISWNRVQEALVHRNPWVRRLAAVAVCLVVSVPVGAVIGLLGPLYGSALLIALAVGYATLPTRFQAFFPARRGWPGQPVAEPRDLRPRRTARTISQMIRAGMMTTGEKMIR